MDSSLQIVVETKTKKYIDKCIICPKPKDNKWNKKLTSTANGRSTIIECSTFLRDNLLDGVEELDQIKYHVNTCYSRYVRQKKRTEDKDVDEGEPEDPTKDEPVSSRNEKSTPETRSSKRLKLDLSNTASTSAFAVKESSCIVCNQMKSKGIVKRFRICEARRAQLFLSAIKFNKDDVYTRCSLLQNIGDVYAADIMNHKKCLENYIRRFEREIEEILNSPLSELEKGDMNTLFKEFVETINVQNKAYALSDYPEQFELYLEKSDHKGSFFSKMPCAESANLFLDLNIKF